jgi:hypothetical protein
MLSWLRTKATKRKKRLFGCACCRRIWNLIGNEKSRSAVLLAERFADGLLTDEDRAVAHAEAEVIAQQPPSPDQGAAAQYAANHARWACANVLHKHAGSAVYASSNAVQVAQWDALVRAGFYKAGQPVYSPEFDALNRRAYNEEQGEQCSLVRELFGNPFRPMPPRQGKRQWEEQRRQWVAANDGIARKLAEVIYDQGRFSDAPILADALEEAGCVAAGLLDHLRGPGPHIRGCWAVDLVLAKK